VGKSPFPPGDLDKVGGFLGLKAAIARFGWSPAALSGKGEALKSEKLTPKVVVIPKMAAVLAITFMGWFIDSGTILILNESFIKIKMGA
jgi:hypothetical protein